MKNFSIKDADEKADFVKCRDFVLKFRLLPLISRRLVIDEMKFVSPEIRIFRDDKGVFNFEGIGEKKKIEEIKKDERVGEEKELAKYIKDEAGWGMIPLKVSGTFAKPVYTVDVAKAGKRAIKKEAEKLMEKLFKKDRGTEGEKAPKERKPVEDLLKELFR